MDKAKTVKNAQPTIKLSDIDFVPILVGLFVILVTLGKPLWWCWELSERRTLNQIPHYKSIFSPSLLLSNLFLVEEEIVQTHLRSDYRSVWFGQNNSFLSIIVRWAARDIHIDRRKCWRLHKWWKRQNGWRRWHTRQRTFTWTILWSVQEYGQSDCVCDWQRDRAKGYSGRRRVSDDWCNDEKSKWPFSFMIVSFFSTQLFVYDFGWWGHSLDSDLDRVQQTRWNIGQGELCHQEFVGKGIVSWWILTRCLPRFHGHFSNFA